MRNKSDRARMRRVTVAIPFEQYAGLIAAKLQSGRTITALVAEGIALVCQRYRDQRFAERAKLTPKAPESKDKENE